MFDLCFKFQIFNFPYSPFSSIFISFFFLLAWNESGGGCFVFFLPPRHINVAFPPV